VAERPCTVTEITQAIKQTLETSFPPLWITGELGDYTVAASGHRYFTLKDESCQLRCVMWRSQKISDFTPEAGMQVLAYGKVAVYERGGQYQLSVSQLFQAGVGQQQLALEALKKKLHEEGLFDPDRKRPLPPYPGAIGVVTSRRGAAIRDILNVLKRRFPAVRVILRPVLVQGDGAPDDIVRGIADLNALGDPDILIVGRGGGSAEDLAAFDTEEVVRAIAGSAIPVISAVGHEIDFSLADLASDCRAPTPSAAAELAVRDRAELLDRVHDLCRKAYDSVTRLLQEDAELLETYRESYGLRRIDDWVLQHMQRVDELHKDLQNGIRSTYAGRAENYRRLTAQLGALSPLSVLTRGYSLAQRVDDDTIVQDAGSLDVGDRLRLRLARGEAVCTVDETRTET
jgi:exodeoxyribonuclease VII large subunit